MNVVDYLKIHSLEKLKNEFGIVVKEYPDLYVLNYDQIESPKLNDIVRECRGLILDKDYNIVSRSFDRFFNYGENETGKDIDITKCSVYDKIDGSLIKIYHHNGHWHVSTRGTAYAESDVGGYGITFKELVYKALNIKTQEEFDNIFDSFNIGRNYTFIFEVTSFENRIVTHYTGYKLWILSIRNNISGNYVAFPESQFESLFSQFGIHIPKRYEFSNIDECIEVVQNLKDLNEGYVVYNDGIPAFKLKSPTYLAVHRLKGEGLTPKRIIDLVNMNEHEEYLTYFEDDRKYFEPYIKAYEVLFDDINFIWEKYKTVRDQKDFAMCVKDFPFASILFRKRKDSEQSFLHLFNLQSDPYKRDLLEKIKNTI